MARRKRADITIEWAQQPRQMTFLRACGLAHPFEGGELKPPVADVIGYGGAAGSGKGDALLMAGIVAGLSVPGISVAYFRREYPMLEGPGGAIMRSHELMSSWARWNGSQRRWTLPTGSVLEFCHCKAEEDVYNYQSQQFDVVLIDEATHFLRSQYRYLRTRNRATRSGITPFMALATNPGNVGHVWFKSEFVDPGPPEVIHEVEVEPGVRERHLFIPAFLSDNRILEQRDPGYRARLEAQPEIVRRQLLEGDWSVFAGQYFKEWRPAIHVVQPFEIPHYWRRFRSLDYGLDCTACYWWAVSQDGRCYVYRELYQPDLILSEAAERIRELTPANERIDYTVASPDLWNRRQDTGVAGYELLIKGGLTGIIRADDRRVPGWRLMREHLKPYRDEQGQEVARLAVFDTCHNLIRTLPALIHDTHNPEDVSDGCEDHGPECLVAGTRVITSTGERLIEDIEPGELVLTRKGFKPVVSSGVTGVNVPVCTVAFSNGARITGTANHPIWVNGTGFVPLECVQRGDLVKVASISSQAIHVPENAVRVVGFCRAGIATVYNLQVEEVPEFYANGVLVHNSIRYGIMSRPPITLEEEERDRRRKWKKERTKPVISELTGY